MEQTSRTQDEEKTEASNNNNVISLQACKVSKERKSACKLQNLGTRISAGTLERFRKFVVDRNGKMNGPFAQEVENALEFYMNNQQQTTTLPITSMGRQKNRPRRDVLIKYHAIVKELRDLESYPYLIAPAIKSGVGRALGKVDKRTYETYLDVIRKLSKEEYVSNRFGKLPMFDVTRFVEKVLSDDW